MNAKAKEKLLLQLGKRVTELRTQQGISQTEFANNIGKDQPSINRLEKGNINPSYIYLCEVAKGLDVSIKELFDFE